MAGKRKLKRKKSGPDLLEGIGPFNLFVISLALAVFGQLIIFNGGKAVPGVILFALAGIVFILAEKASKGPGKSEEISKKTEAVMLGLIMLTAVFFRVYMIDKLPAGCYRDEGQNGLEAINIMKSIELAGTTLPVYIERWTQNAALYMYFIAASFKAFGIGVMQIRLVSIVFGILCVPAFYFLVRGMFGPRAAIIGGFLIAVARWHINFSRMGFLGIVTVFFVILALYFAYRAYKEEKLSDFVLMGVVSAFSVYSYIAARLIPAGLFLFFLIYFIVLLMKNRKSFKKNFKKVFSVKRDVSRPVFGLLAGAAALAVVLQVYSGNNPVIGAAGMNFKTLSAALFFKLLAVGIFLYYLLLKFFRPKTAAGFIAPASALLFTLFAYFAKGAVPAMVCFIIALAVSIYTLFHFGYSENAYLKKVFMAVFFFTVIFAPMGNYILQHPENFMSRASTVSIFNKEMLREIGGRYVNDKTGEPKKWTTLYAENIGKTLLMYNYKGDGNPRHNYHTVPMLDFGTGIFAALGFFFVLFRIQKPVSFFLLAVYLALLQAGLFSTEAPQAYRTISVIPLVLLFAILPAQRFMAYFREQYGKKLVPVIYVLIFAGLAWAGYANYDTYFNKFRSNPGSWAEFSTNEYHMGKYVKSLGSGWTAIVRPDWVDSYTFRFATYPLKNYERFSPSKWIPIQPGIVKNYAYVLDRAYLPLLDVLRSMYPKGEYSDFRHKFFPGRILYWVYEVPYSEVKKQQESPEKNGLIGYYYYDNIQKTNRKEAVKLSNHWQGKPRFAQRDPFILFNWTQDPILGPFSVEWKGFIDIPKSGEYVFETRSNDYSDLFIGGKQVLVNPGGGGGLARESGSIYLEKGRHRIKLRYYESVHYSKMQFWWKTPSSGGKPEIVPSGVLIPKKRK